MKACMHAASASDSPNQLHFASTIHTKPNFINLQTQAMKDGKITVRKYFLLPMNILDMIPWLWDVRSTLQNLESVTPEQLKFAVESLMA